MGGCTCVYVVYVHMAMFVVGVIFFWAQKRALWKRLSMEDDSPDLYSE